MLDLKFIRENPDIVKKSIKNRGLTLDIDELLAIDSKRREILMEMEELRHKKNIISQEIGKKIAQKGDVNQEKSEIKTISQKIDEIEPKVEDLDIKLSNLLLLVPNIPHNSVPIGADPQANKIVREWGEGPKFKFEPRSHIELADILDIIDFKRASKIVGSFFILYKGLGARLERALINFMLDLHTKRHGYKEIFPPFLVNRKSMTGTGQLPKLEEDMYCLRDDDYFLIPTAEVPVTNLHRDEVIPEEKLPIYYTAYTACFRREAGSYGKDTKGIFRVHQFDKVEMFSFCRPEDSIKEHKFFLELEEKLMQTLKLPYRVVNICTGDLGRPAAAKYDIETWLPSENKYRETHSTSNCTDFQTRRLNIRYRTKEGKLNFVHTVNGTAFSQRPILAIIENYQQKDGSILVPEVLQKYVNFKVIK